MRSIEQDGQKYVCVDDLARALFDVADDLGRGKLYEDQIASTTAERIAYSILGGNLSNITLVIDRPKEA